LSRAGASEERKERRRLVGLGDVMIEAGELRERSVARVVAPGDGNEQRSSARISLAKRARHLVAADERHADVEEYHVGAEVAHHVEHRAPGIDAAHFVSFGAQQLE
jgi:hypothetical protein